MSRDQAILDHLRRYRISTRGILEKVFFEGKSSKNVLARLRQNGQIQVAERALEDNQSYYYLAEQPAPGSATAFRDLKILHFCFPGKRSEERPRERLASEDLTALFGDEAPNEDHCMLPRDGGFVVLRIYTPATDVEGALRQMRKHLADAQDNSVLRSWVETWQYGFLILGETKPFCGDLVRALQKRDGQTPPLQQQALFHVEYVGASRPKGLSS